MYYKLNLEDHYLTEKTNRLFKHLLYRIYLIGCSLLLYIYAGRAQGPLYGIRWIIVIITDGSHPGLGSSKQASLADLSQTPLGASEPFSTLRGLLPFGFFGAF